MVEYAAIRLRKAEWKALERLFVTEVHPSPLFVQSKAKPYRRLDELGLAEEVTVGLPGKYGVLRVKTWKLTVRGHVYYCEHCTLPEHDDPDE